jgi:hypothetical protein
VNHRSFFNTHGYGARGKGEEQKEQEPESRELALGRQALRPMP